MKEVTSLEGPVVKVNGELALLIPLEDGGTDLIECSRGISEVVGEYLKILIPEWLAGTLRVEEGDMVCVHNSAGKFHIQAATPRLVH
jgi:hypothetical protein